jgi:hypothetical protein
MATSRGPFAKRQKELARREKQKEKQARRLEAKDRPAEPGALPEGEDPDIAGIQLGPQPPADEAPPDDVSPGDDREAPAGAEAGGNTSGSDHRRK